jgi:hypothetical protein
MWAVALSCWEEKIRSTSSFFILKHPVTFFTSHTTETRHWMVSFGHTSHMWHRFFITWKVLHIGVFTVSEGKKWPNNPSHTQHTTHQPWHQVTALQGSTRDFLQMNTCYSKTSHIHWDVIKVFFYTGHAWSLLIQHVTNKGSSSQTPVLFHNLCRGAFLNYGCTIWVQIQLFWCTSHWLHKHA